MLASSFARPKGRACQRGIPAPNKTSRRTLRSSLRALSITRQNNPIQLSGLFYLPLYIVIIGAMRIAGAYNTRQKTRLRPSFFVGGVGIEMRPDTALIPL
jgi:hypothetical protein